MRRGATVPAVVFAVCSMVLAGCIAEDVAVVQGPEPVDLTTPNIRVGGEEGDARAPLFFPLPALDGPTLRDPSRWSLDDPSCAETPDRCATVEIALDIPAAFWDDHAGFVEVSVRAEPGDDAASITAYLRGETSGYDEAGRGGRYSKTFLIETAPSDTYTLEIHAYDGHLNGTGVVEFEVAPRNAPVVDGPVRDLLPDLVMAPPKDLKIDLETWDNLLNGNPIPGPVRTVAGLAAPGCAPDEITEEGARRCLRVSTAVGNMGEGPLEVRLPGDDYGVYTTGAMFYQRVHRSDGTHYDREAGNEGTFHASHAHLHYPHLVSLQVFAYDETTGTRGAEVGKGSKTGFCLVSEGLFALGLNGTEYPSWPDEGACYATPGEDWAMGIWPQWFDMYEPYRTGQYAEISGVPDGVYEFVVTADPMDTILESDETNNEDSVLIRITGNEVEAVEDGRDPAAG